MKHKKTKARYRLRHWGEYNRALVQRGSLTMWLSNDMLAAWRNSERTGKRGHPQDYTDTAILARATLQEISHLGLRQTEGLRESRGELLHLEVAIPDYSTLSRRRATLEVALPRRWGQEALPVGVDSTGVKGFGEGEWKVRQQGDTYRRTRKVHLGVDEASREMVAAGVSPTNYPDSQLLPDLWAQVDEEIAQVSGDGGDDRRSCYEASCARPARAENLRPIRQLGRAAWKRESGYPRRSLAETTMFRLKTLFSERVTARGFAGQAAQLLVRCAALNRMTQVGMPTSYRV